MRSRPSPSRLVAGSLSALSLVVVLTAVMFPLRSHLSGATTALVLVVPVVLGVSVGGFVAGTVGIVGGFLAYDLVFIRPYYSLSGSAQNWVALAVYIVVMLITAQVVSRLDAAREEAQQRAVDVRRLFDVSELLVGERTTPELLSTIVSSMRNAFGLRGVALLLPSAQRLELVATDGEPLSEEELRRLSSQSGQPVRMEGAVPGDGLRVVALSVSGTPNGLLALRGISPAGDDRELTRAFANHVALALERSVLREQAMRAALVEEVDRLGRSLVAAVSHDLRTPLATIKLASTTLIDSGGRVADEDSRELLGLIDAQSDRLDRLVANLLDMTRIQAGTLQARPEPIEVADLVEEAVEVLGTSVPEKRISIGLPPDLPLVDADRVLARQILVNVIDNAMRYAPEDTVVEVDARLASPARVEVSVTDEGPGVPEDERSVIFQMVNNRETGGRTGLGLLISKAFAEAQGQEIWAEDAPSKGARFTFTLPVSRNSPATAGDSAS